ncbi:hypothetical protein F5144DRAFT_623806 [Chaetomium tenue]|uniref:Uncharacterized protein n=1 Tax=Chaetomium tenue TaxID=1854479 RepID=A0ACB7NUJ4_9PEZI|nr:hypothetical protein F5144DRAFT_623806 [Chaetomium globosum]
MASLGKMTNAALKPAEEFLPVGSALTVRRRQEAETGPTHRTACKLGFLFHEVIPDTPKLIKAYGRRVSEILSHPGINPQGTESDGPFQPFVGADCTSIWAAATSGSIGVLLLACMLADAWDVKKAISIWVEIIEERKATIRAAAEANKLINPHTTAAAQQEYTRAELASWDASVRAWLRRANASMKVRRTQFALIEQNLTIPYPRGASTYETVRLTWTRAMEVLEKLLNNVPQEGYDRAVIRGISAWHLYPDLLVFQADATKVPFRDPLFRTSAILTLGLEYKGQPSDNFTRWSLALSHLRYYGDPVPVRSTEQLSRLHISQLWLVALGVIFCKWDIPYTRFDDALRWFEELGRRLNQTRRFSAELPWLSRLCSAATGLEGEKRNTATMLVKYGWRRGSNFLGSNIAPDVNLAFFGLCNRNVMEALNRGTDIESGIQYLRGIASALPLNPEDAIIMYDGKIAGHEYSEWASIHPIGEHLAKRGGVGPEPSTSSRYARWLHCAQPKAQGSSREVERQLLERLSVIESTGETCKVVTEEEYFLDVPAVRAERVWKKPPNLFAGQVTFKHITGPWSLSSQYTLWVRASKYVVCVQELDARMKTEFGQPQPLEQGVNWLRGMGSPDRILKYLLALAKVKLISNNLKPSPHVKHRSEPLSTTAVRQGIKRKRSHSPEPQAPSEPSRQSSEAEARAVPALEFDDTDQEPDGCFFMISHTFLYDAMPSATVSLKVTEQELVKARWLPASIQNALRVESPADAHRTAYMAASRHVEPLGRAQAFACVIMFESGCFNIDPEKLDGVIALCSEDSIFVSELLLSDPSVDANKLKIRHIIGNVGVAGMVCMVPPYEPRIRPLGHDASLVSHAPYDGTLSDSFPGTSLHLSFTTWKVPLDWDSTGDIDHEIFLLESVVSVQDQGRWVADIDVLGIETDRPDVVSFSCECEHKPLSDTQNVVSISSWEEFLDHPPCIGVMQTNKNWAARLATVSILIQQGNGHTAAILEGGKLLLGGS